MDLLLKNATIIDGTGSDRRTGSVAIDNGRILAVGTVEGTAEREIDLQGAVVAPGFIDVHTHYDAQAFWDPMLSPSVYHGVSTVIAGNCGFTLAPLSGRPEDSDYLLRMLSRVEGMPLSTLRLAVHPDWRGFGEFLDRIDGTLAVNTAFLVGHSALRRSVMGERAVGHEATDKEIAAMCALLGKSLAEGGCGFSTTISHTHLDYEGEPVPSRWASRDEYLALAETTGRYPGTWLELVHGKLMLQEEDYAFLSDMSITAGRPLNWNLVSVNSATPEVTESHLRAGDHAAQRGGIVHGLVPAVPIIMVLNFMTGFLLEALPGWGEIFRLPPEKRLRALADPQTRAALEHGAETAERTFFRFPTMTIATVTREANQIHVGQTLTAYADAVGKSVYDAMFDLVIEEQLQVTFATEPSGGDEESWRMRLETWRDERAMIGASDAGAHLDMINTFAFSTQLLGEGVRERGLLGLEEAVKLITKVPADRFGLRERGELTPGYVADIVIFDPLEIGCGPIELRADLPGGESRLYADADGIRMVIVNGEIVVQDGAATGTHPGRVLRSGRDTRTVSVNATLERAT